MGEKVSTFWPVKAGRDQWLCFLVYENWYATEIHEILEQNVEQLGADLGLLPEYNRHAEEHVRAVERLLVSEGDLRNFRIDPPGTRDGPCESGCGHEMCIDLRQAAQTACSVCEERIGYDREFCMVTGRDGNVELTHAACQQEGAR